MLATACLPPPAKAAPNSPAPPDDLQTVRQRLLRSLLASAAPAAARHDAATLSPDGSWPDVNYSDTTRTGGWSPHLHLDRTINMAACVRAANGSGPAAALVPRTRSAIDYWLKTDPRSLNWWWNELQVPARIADAALLFRPWIRTQHTLAVLSKFMERADYSKRTGANLDDEVATAIKRGVLFGNRSLVAAAFARLWEEIRVVQPSGCLDPPRGTQGCPTDGIQADSSFHQHGPELLAGSYGEGFAAATLSSIALADGTAFAPNASQAALFASLLLDGMRWMTVGTPARWDWSVKGRDMGTVARRVELNVTLLSMSGREDELAAFGAAIDGRQAPALLGHRGYWTSDYAVIRGTSVRLAWAPFALANLLAC